MPYSQKYTPHCFFEVLPAETLLTVVIYGKKVIFSLILDQLLVNGFLLTKIKEISLHWLLSIDVKPFDVVNDMNQNVFRVKSGSGSIVCEVILAIGSTTLKVKAFINGGTKIINLLSDYKTLQMDQYSTLKIFHIYDDVMKAYVIEVVLNGISLGYKENTDPKRFYNTEVFTNYGTDSKVYMKNFYLLNLV